MICIFGQAFSSTSIVLSRHGTGTGPRSLQRACGNPRLRPHRSAASQAYHACIMRVWYACDGTCHLPVPVLAGCTRWACTRRSPSAASASAAPSRCALASAATPFSPQNPESPPLTAPPAASKDDASVKLEPPTMRSFPLLVCSILELCSSCLDYSSSDLAGYRTTSHRGAV